jgi:hypothetical protein
MQAFFSFSAFSMANSDACSEKELLATHLSCWFLAEELLRFLADCGIEVPWYQA